jgi:hypothetical protein
MEDSDEDDFRYLLGEIDTQRFCNPEEIQEDILKDGLIPMNLLTGNVFSNGQNALHIILKVNLPIHILDVLVDKLLHLGVDPRKRDNDSILCTEGNITYNQIVRKIDFWILTRYPVVWTDDFVRKYIQKIFNLGYKDYYYDVVNQSNKIVLESMKKYYNE